LCYRATKIVVIIIIIVKTLRMTISGKKLKQLPATGVTSHNKG